MIITWPSKLCYLGQPRLPSLDICCRPQAPSTVTTDSVILARYPGWNFASIISQTAWYSSVSERSSVRPTAYSSNPLRQAVHPTLKWCKAHTDRSSVCPPDHSSNQKLVRLARQILYWWAVSGGGRKNKKLRFYKKRQNPMNVWMNTKMQNSPIKNHQNSCFRNKKSIRRSQTL